MMYNEKFVACVKVNGKVMREYGEDILIPFGCEYSILLKNLNTVKASVNVSIDGEEVISGLVIYPNSETELERWYNKPYKFKFIEKTDKVREHRGEGVEDGIVRIEYQFEQIYPITYTNVRSGWYSSSTKNLNYDTSSLVDSSFNNQIYSCCSQPINDDGITVEGNDSKQSFRTVSSFPLEYNKHVILFRLKGDTGQYKVEVPVTVRKKIECKSCGAKNKSSMKFCPDCGTRLL